MIVHKFRYASLKKIVSSKNAKVFIMIENISNQLNLGRILRLSYSLNINGIILSNNKYVSITSFIERVSTGFATETPIAYSDNIMQSLNYLKSNGFLIIGTSRHGTINLSKFRFKYPCVLVLGNEERGIQPSTNKLCDYILFIHSKYSINIVDSTAIFLYEMFKQIY